MGDVGARSKGQLLAYVAAAVLVALAGFRYIDGGGDDEPAAPVEIEADGARAPGTDGAGGRLFVHVAGAVHDEGLYRLPGGTRVGAAIDRAGGVKPAADLSVVNLAAELQDGQQVVVPTRSAAAAASAAATAGSAAPPGSSTAGSPAAPVSLAQATPEQLDAEVDGIGPVLAAAIIEYRDENGGVSSIDELIEVDGIGEERISALREALVP